MEETMNVAAYIAKRYASEFNTPIDEMKLHKLMYFAQRESFIKEGKPLFDATFYGWKYGPVLKEIRSAIDDGTFETLEPVPFNANHDAVFDKLFSFYATRNSWSLSSLSQSEVSWQNSRKGIDKYANSDNPMSTDDIRIDAENIIAREKLLDKLFKRKG